MLNKRGALYKIILLDRTEDKEEKYEKVLNSKLLEEKEEVEKYANNILIKKYTGLSNDEIAKISK